MTQAFRTIGIDIGGTAIKIAVVWNDGRVVESRQIPTQADAGPEAAQARILACITALQQAHGLESAAMRALGMDSAGIIDSSNNLVLDAPNLRSWQRYPLAARLGAALGVPAFLENDVNAMAYGEWHCGAGGAAGEVGHMSLDRNGPRCACGNFGCLERYVGARYIVARAQAMLERDPRSSSLRDVTSNLITPLAISQAAAAGDGIAAAVWEETGIWLGVALASLVNVLNPERIVIGGGVARAGELLLAPARRTILERAMALPAARAEVVTAALGNDAAVVGAAMLALARAGVS